MALYPVFFIIILKSKGLFVWTNLEQMAAYEASGGNCLKYAAMACMILFACAYCLIPLCLQSSSQNRLYPAISALFGLAFCTCVSVAYFVQLTATRLQLLSGLTVGLEQLTQANPLSAINAINLLGWTLFFPLSTLALVPVFDRSRRGKQCKALCLANTAILLVALGAYIANNTLLLMLTMYPALGVASIGLCCCFLAYFRAAPLQ